MIRDLVTIVIPAYNTEEFLYENVESIVNQTYQNLEIIYVCDGCTDHTVEILQEYAKSDSRIIVWIESENHGAARARNIGMNKANGEWLVFGDADDIYEYSAIEDMIAVAIKERADLVCSYWEYFDNVPNRNSTVNNSLKKLYCNTYPVIDTKKEVNHIMQLVENAAWGKLIHKSLYTRREIFFLDIPNAEDVYFTRVIALNACKIAYVDKVLYHYRSNKDRFTLSTAGDLKRSYILEALDKVYEYIVCKENSLSFLRSFNNDVFMNLSVYLGSPVYSELFNKMRTFYFEKWKMLQQEIMGELNCINRIMYKNVISNNISNQDIYMQAKVEFVKRLSDKGCSIWGIGQMGSALLEEISKTDIKIQHVFDSAQDKWGKRIHGYLVENFDEVKSDNIIITVPGFYDEIVKSIRKHVNHVYNLEKQIWIIPDK